MREFFIACLTALLFTVAATAADCGCQARPAAKPAPKVAPVPTKTQTVVIHSVMFPRLHAVRERVVVRVRLGGRFRGCR